MNKIMKRSVVLLIIFVFVIALSCKMDSESGTVTTETPENTTTSKVEIKNNIVDFTDLTVRPELLERSAPVYPKEALKSGVSGLVTIKVLIGLSGEVEKTEVIKSIPELDEAAIDAVKKFKFKPAQVDGEIVKTWMAIPVSFKLN